jgi:hypothetical protein
LSGGEPLEIDAEPCQPRIRRHDVSAVPLTPDWLRNRSQPFDQRLT